MRARPILLAAIPLFRLAAATADDAPPLYREVKEALSKRCTQCHSNDVDWHGYYEAQAGIRYDTAEEVRTFAKQTFRTVTQTRIMPPGNITGMTDEERKLVADWFAAGAKTP